MAVFRIIIFSMVTFLAACTEGFVDFPVTQQAQDAELPANIDVVRLTALNAENFNTPRLGFQGGNINWSRDWDYRVGPGDVLTVIVFGYQELNVPGGAGGGERTEAGFTENGLTGFAVQSDGFITYPFIGRVLAAGNRPEAIRSTIARRLAEFFPDPQVDLRISRFASQSIVVTGEVSRPNRQVLTTVPTTLIEAVNEAGGLTDDAEPSLVTIRRNGRLHNVNLAAFLNAGVNGNNPVLRNGDVVNVPRRETQEAYLLGEVGRPGVVDLAQDSVTLTQALARQGGLDELRSDARGIFVFRLVEGRQTVYQLDISDPTGFLHGTRFVLAPEDVIYVVRAPLTRWNDTISRLLPSVTAVQGVGNAVNTVQ